MNRCGEILGTPREWATRLTIGAVAGAFFGVIGPFGSWSAPFAVRVAYWTLGFCLGVTIFSLAIRGATRAARRIDLPEWFAIGAAVAIVCLPYSLVIGWLFNDLRWPTPTPRFLLERYGQTLLLAAPLTIGYVALARLSRRLQPTAPPAPHAPPAVSPKLEALPAPPAFFLDRLPPKLGRDLLALQMEDHYVRAHTPRGSELVLIPMRQAVEELATIEGHRTHRSWWVARSAVQAVREDGRNVRLVLKGGLEAPVARTSVADLRAAGWLTADPPGGADAGAK